MTKVTMNAIQYSNAHIDVYHKIDTKVRSYREQLSNAETFGSYVSIKADIDRKVKEYKSQLQLESASIKADIDKKFIAINAKHKIGAVLQDPNNPTVTFIVDKIEIGSPSFMALNIKYSGYKVTKLGQKLSTKRSSVNQLVEGIDQE